MSEKTNVLAGTQLLPTLVALIVLGGVLWVEKPLQSKRSPEKDEPSLFRLADASAPARLWEDPFETVSRHLLGADALLETRSSEFQYHYCNLLRQVGNRHVKLTAQQASDFDAVLIQCEARKPRRFRPKGKASGEPLAARPATCSQTRKALAEIQGLRGLRDGIAPVDRENKLAEQVLIAGVTLVGGTLNDQAEYRRRVRIAFISALHRRGFIAAREDKLSYLLFPEDSQNAQVVPRLFYGLQPKDQLMAVPYEIFETRQGAASSLPSTFTKVVVLWLDQDRFERAPEQDLQRIVGELAALPGTEEIPPAITTTLIGPGSSSALVKMLRKEPPKEGLPVAIRCSTEPTTDYTIEAQNLVKVWSPYATAQFGIAQRFAGIEPPAGKTDADELKRMNISRTIVDDAEVLHAVIGELKRRGIDLYHDPTVNVALVTELDTSYGQALPLTFQADTILSGVEKSGAYHAEGFKHWLGVLRERPRIQPEEDVLQRIRIFRYLRGLDGVFVATKPGAEAAAAQASLRDKTQRGNPERAEGPSLLDMIRSLGMELKDHDEKLRLYGKRIHAIGILGTDFYDKQLALQALRPAFPDAVFFTTDLDARYLHRDDQGWNRNLLVGSSFGFQLAKSLQDEVPPFRDNYSTSTFLSGLLSLGPCAAPGGEGCRLIDAAINQNPLSLRPLLFEIGISRPQQLGQEFEAGSSRLQPMVSSEWKIPRTNKKFFFVIALVAAISWVVSRRVQKHTGLLALATFYLIGSFVAVTYFFAEEPAEMLDGVSVRGTEILRLLLIGSAVVLFIVLRKKVRDAQAEIAPRFERVGGAKLQIELKPWEWIYISSAFEKYKSHQAESEAGPAADDEEAEGSPDPGQEVDAALAWECYQKLQGQVRGFDRQMVRVLVMTLASFTIVGVGAMWLRGYFEFPLVPVRGGLIADKVLRYLSLGCLTFACFWTLDTVRICVRFIDWLAEGKTVWPANPKNIRSTVRRRLPLKYLGDYLDIRVIAPLTEAVSWTVLYPFFLLSIYILSRGRFFDYWTWPWIVGSIVVVLLGSIVIAAVILQRSARKARESTLKFLHLLRTNEAAKDTRAAEPRTKQLEILIQEVESIHRGAFGPWTSNPIVGALLLPFGGFSAASLIEFSLQVGL